MSEVIKEIGEMRRRIKGIEGKVYRLEVENKKFCKEIRIIRGEIERLEKKKE